MAEAVVEDPHRFFCHKCSLEISSVLPDYTCPRCCSGFIEALDGQSAPTEQGDESDEDIDMQPWELLNDVFLMGMSGDENDRRHGRASRTRDGDRRPGRNNRTRHTFENLMHLFVMNLNADLGGAHANVHGSRGGTIGPEIFVGNPGDYAWGREGFDSIVTQLLNQIESTGPPPLTKEKISEIPVVFITQEQVDKLLQCSVCWENFKVDEPVRKLVCTHVYHEGCIIPWLELHGTCPVCRKPLSSEAEQAATTDDVGRRETLRNLAAQLTPGLPFAAQQGHFSNQLRQINQHLEEARTRYNTRAQGNASSSSTSGISHGEAASNSAGSSSLPTEASMGEGNTPSSSSTGNSSSQGNVQDMDVD